jgi:hypothetical protein
MHVALILTRALRMYKGPAPPQMATRTSKHARAVPRAFMRAVLTAKALNSSAAAHMHRQSTCMRSGKATHMQQNAGCCVPAGRRRQCGVPAGRRRQ